MRRDFVAAFNIDRSGLNPSAGVFPLNNIFFLLKNNPLIKQNLSAARARAMLLVGRILHPLADCLR